MQHQAPVGKIWSPSDKVDDVIVVFALLDSGIVFPMVPNGFVSLRVSILLPDLVTSIPLLKFLFGQWFHSLCSVPVTLLKWMMVGWIVGSIWFAVSDLSVSTILTDPPISVVGNNIWPVCSIPIIWFLVILFPSGVAIRDDSSKFSRKGRKYVSVTSLIVLLVFFKLFCLCLKQLFGTQSFSYFPLFFERNLKTFLTISFSPIFPLLYGYTISIDGNVHNFFEIKKCSVPYMLHVPFYNYQYKFSCLILLHINILIWNWMNPTFLIYHWCLSPVLRIHVHALNVISVCRIHICEHKHPLPLLSFQSSPKSFICP